MTTYKDIILSYNDEEWRLNRLKSVIDFFFLEEAPKYINILHKIYKLEDDKGILNIYYTIKLTDYEKICIKYIWHEENEHIVNYIHINDKINKYCQYCKFPDLIELPKQKNLSIPTHD